MKKVARILQGIVERYEKELLTKLDKGCCDVQSNSVRTQHCSHTLQFCAGALPESKMRQT